VTEKIYQYTLYAVLSITAVFSLFLITSDNLSPFTTQASLHRNIVSIAPEVSGVIEHVSVSNGQKVSKGDLLFTINADSYQLKVVQAQAELKQAEESYKATQQQLIAAQQTLGQRKAELHNQNSRYQRAQSMFKKGLSTAQELDDTKTNVDVARSALSVAQAEIDRIEAQLSGTDTNAAIQLAKAKLASAQLDETHTRIVAKTDGVVTNLQLQQGSYITQGSPALLLVNEAQTWLSADFNEKGMAHLVAGREVKIAFDALPGQIFIGHIESQERAIHDADNSSGQLSSVINDSRWIRDQQKIRVRITVEALDPSLIAGARASVSVSDPSSWISPISSAWIHLVSMFRYLY